MRSDAKNPGGPIRAVGIVAGAVAAAAFLFIPILSQWAQPFSYRLIKGFAPVPRFARSTVVVALETTSLKSALADLSGMSPQLVAVDAALWQEDPSAAAQLVSSFSQIPAVLGWNAEVGSGSTAPAAIPKLATLEGTVDFALPDLRTVEMPDLKWPPHVTSGFSFLPASQIFEAPVLARGPGGLMPSLGLEVLRRVQRISPDRIAYVDGVGILVGKQITVPVGNQGNTPLRFGAPAPLPGSRLRDGGVKSLVAGKIVFLASARHGVHTVDGTKLAAEIWASQVDEALTGKTPKVPGSGMALAWAVGLAGTAILILAYAFGMGAGGLGGLTLALTLLFPVASWIFFMSADWWLAPERPFFAILFAGLIVTLVRAFNPGPPSPPHTRPKESVRIAKKTESLGETQPQHDAPRPTQRIRHSGPGERTAATPDGDPGIERDAQGNLARIGRYRIVRKMGHGSAGEVFEGQDTQMSRRVAIKAMIRGAQLHFDHAHERFIMEAKAAGSLNHPNINTIYDFGTIHGVSYMVLEYLDGATLAQWMRAHPTPPTPYSIREWVHQICSALDYAHEHRIIHRDLKPSNLMIVDGGRTIKLLDFGVAKVEDVMLTQAGMTVGTPSYMSPEQLQGEKVTSASDQYSLAVVLYQIFSYRLPYAGTRLPEICTRILRGDITPLNEGNPALTDCWNVLQPAMSRDPAHRYPSCMAMWAALDSLWVSEPA